MHAILYWYKFSILALNNTCLIINWCVYFTQFTTKTYEQKKMIYKDKKKLVEKKTTEWEMEKSVKLWKMFYFSRRAAAIIVV